MISGDFELNEVKNNSRKSNVNATPLSKHAQERIDALAAAGVDTSNYFAMGEDMVVRVVDGVPSQVLDDDPVYKRILGRGFVPEPRLFRRWVLAQTFYLLRYPEPQYVGYKGYEYQWRMTEEELRVQSKLYGHDMENFADRNMFFNKDIVVAMANNYFDKLVNYINALHTHKCKGTPYKRIKYMDVFVADLKKKVYEPVAELIRKIEAAKTPLQLYTAVTYFNAQRIKISFDKFSVDWLNAYKGAGAFFSFQNLIRFHGLKVYVEKNGKMLKGEDALSYVRLCAHNKEGWELLGMLKDALRYNCIDVNKDIKDWNNLK